MKGISEDLLRSYFEGELSESEARTLSRWLEADRSNVDRFVELLFIEGDVSDALRKEEMRQFLGAVPENARTETTSQSRRWAALSLVLATAAAIMVAAYSWFFVGQPAALIVDADRQAESTLSTDSQGSPTNEDKPIVATATSLVDCRWRATSARPACGDHLSQGEVLSLESGYLTLTFVCGASVLIEGPAEFHLLNDKLGSIIRGNLSAIVPDHAIGFTVLTPSSEIVDLGTEFGVSVDEHGTSEIHVFKGEVVTRGVTFGQGSVDSSAIRLKQHAAVRYSGHGDHPEPIEANERKFRRQSRDSMNSLASDLPVMRGLGLWLAADKVVEKTNDGGVIAWRDTLSAGNDYPDDAFQGVPDARPTWVDNVWNGKPIIRFNGASDYLVTTPMATGNDQTIVSVVSLAPETNVRGQLLNYNGPPSRYLDKISMSIPGVLQLALAPSPRLENEYHCLAFAYPGFNRKEWRRKEGALFISFAESILHKPLVVIYVYDMTNNEARLYLNGVKRGETSAPWPIEIVSRKVIGRHAARQEYFAGDLAELAIFNVALSDEEVVALSEELKEKYAVVSVANSILHEDRPMP